jgi:hypothetical protein
MTKHTCTLLYSVQSWVYTVQQVINIEHEVFLDKVPLLTSTSSLL